MSEHNSKTTLSTKEAAALAKCTTKHIQNLINRTKLSATRDKRGNFIIDKSEFYRVFPEAHIKRTDANDDDSSSRTILELENKHLKELLAEKTKQNELLLKHLENATTEKTMLIETLNNHQKLLEYDNKPRKRKRFLGIF